MFNKTNIYAKKIFKQKKSGSTSPPQSGKRDSKLVQARAALYLHPRPLKGAIRVTGSRRRQIKKWRSSLRHER